MGEFRDISIEDKIYSPGEILDVLHKVRPHFRFSYTKTALRYFNIPCCFDIETTSFFRSTGIKDDDKTAIMYVWTFGIFGAVIIGRTWEEFIQMLDLLSMELNLNKDKRLLIYCHNLSFEFEFIRKWLKWEKVFAIDNHRPVYALTTGGIEFRCSLLLSGYSLEKLAENLQHFKIEKLVGDLDYTLMRHNNTPLTNKEISYCVNDVKIVMCYIAERIIDDGGISLIPLTKTGYVRKYCRNSCFYTPGKPREKDSKHRIYREIMNGLRLTPDEYDQLKRGFQGGFTHCNAWANGKIFHDVTSFDFTSSYPCTMIAEQFPMSSSERINNITPDDFYHCLSCYCCLFDVEFINIRPHRWNENYISISRCWDKAIPYIVNNGRLVTAAMIKTTITEVDYMIINMFYDWDKMRVSNFRRYKKGYLPTDFVKSILKLYQDKTTLKGVTGKEVEYLKSKEMLNSCYGMCVTDIVREEFPYTDHWLTEDEKKKKNTDSAIVKYNNSPSRFLFYPWGVWVTAYARRNLFSGIIEFGDDYLYSDTDSIKVINAENHMKYITDYNTRIREQLQHAMEHHKIDISAIEPLTQKGEKKCLGVWDFDGHYSRFKTIGAKRYLVEYSKDKRNEKPGKIELTVAGINKRVVMPYLLKEYGKKGVFDVFNFDLELPADFTGKNVHTYIDTPKIGTLIDYRGIPGDYLELSGVHLSQSEYSFSASEQYTNYLLSKVYERINYE